MSLPPLYKLMNMRGARLTLGNQTFRHAKPSEFNDTEDLTTKSLFPEDVDTTLASLPFAFSRAMTTCLHLKPTCEPNLAAIVARVQSVYRASPQSAAEIERELQNEGIGAVLDVERFKGIAEGTVREINEFMQRFRVFCVTTLIDSDRVWNEYTDRHKGIALRVVPSVLRDSHLQAFSQVRYCESRPPLFESLEEFITGGLFGDQEQRRRESVERIIYTKTLQWAYEGEYRVAVALGQNERHWDTLRFHAEEITELYLGTALSGDEKVEAVGLARAVNPKIVVLEVTRSDSGHISFERLC